MANEHEVFFEHNYLPALKKDLQEAQHLVILHCPFLGTNQIDILEPDIKACIARGVRVCIFVELPNPKYKQDEEKVARTLRCLKRLAALGAHITRKSRIHEKFALFDERIGWDGSMNMLSHFDTTERIYRWTCRAKFWEIVWSHKLDTCLGCASVPGFWHGNPDGLLLVRKRIGQDLSDRRKELGLTQAQLAKQLGMRQTDISQIEGSGKNVKVNKMLQVAFALRIPLLPVHWALLPNLNDAMQNRVPATPFDPQSKDQPIFVGVRPPTPAKP